MLTENANNATGNNVNANGSKVQLRGILLNDFMRGILLNDFMRGTLSLQMSQQVITEFAMANDCASEARQFLPVATT